MEWFVWDLYVDDVYGVLRAWGVCAFFPEEGLGGKKKKKGGRGADSVITMARMFNSGAIPGNSLSALQETSLEKRHAAKYRPTTSTSCFSLHLAATPHSCPTPRISLYCLRSLTPAILGGR